MNTLYLPGPTSLKRLPCDNLPYVTSSIVSGFCLALLVYNLMHLVSRAFCKEEEEGENSVPVIIGSLTSLRPRIFVCWLVTVRKAGEGSAN